MMFKLLLLLRRQRRWVIASSLVLLTAILLTTLAPQPDTQALPPARLAVPVVNVAPRAMAIPVLSRGHISMAREFHLNSQVQGRVLEVSDRFVSGAYIEAGELLLQIDPQPYELDVRQRQADLDSRLLQQEETRAKAAVARRQAANNDYARFIPQLRMADSQVQAAREALDYARQQLAATRVTAPVSGRIASASVQPGQQVSPATPLGVINDDRWQEVRLPVSEREAQLLGIRNGASEVPVQVFLFTHPEANPVPAMMVRTEAQRGQFQQIVLIAQPEYRPGEQPLLPGTFVEAEIRSAVLENVSVIPRAALQAGDRLLMVDDQQRLQSVAADILYRGKELVYLGNAFAGKAQVVNSSRRSLASGSLVLPVLSSPAQLATVSSGQE